MNILITLLTMCRCRRGDNFWSAKDAYTGDVGETGRRAWDRGEDYVGVHGVIQVGCAACMLFTLLICVLSLTALFRMMDV